MSECKGQVANTAPPSGLADALWCVGLVRASGADGRTARDEATVKRITTVNDDTKAEEVASLRAEVARLSSLLEEFKTAALEIVPSAQEGFYRLDEDEECGVCGYVGPLVDSRHGESGDFDTLGQWHGPACPVCVAAGNVPHACDRTALERLWDTMARLVMLAEGAS